MRSRVGWALLALLALPSFAPALRADEDVKKPEAKDMKSSPVHHMRFGTFSEVPEVEPNDHPAQANVLGCGNTFRPAAIAAGAVRDTDWISFTANAGDVVTFGTDADGASPIGDTRISLVSSDGVTVLGTDDDSGPGRYSLLSLCAPYTGTYYGRIAAFSSQTGSYMAFVTCTPSSAPANDRCDGAIAIACGSIFLSGSTADACPDYSLPAGGCTGFAADGRDVVYKVNAFTGDSLYLDYQQEQADASIYIVTDCSNPGGTCVAGSDTSVVGGHETLHYRFPTAGTYYIVLDSFSPGSGGPWTASGTLVCAPDRVDTLSSLHTDVDLVGPWGTETIALNGSGRLASTLHALRLGFSGTESVPTELTQLDLAGNSLNAGPVTVRLLPATSAPFQRSLGSIEETLNSTPGVLDLPPYAPSGSAYLQLHAYLEVEIPALKLDLHTDPPTNPFGLVHRMPADTGETLLSVLDTPLLDANGGSTTYRLRNVKMTPYPAVVTDTLPDSRITLDLKGPLGLETVTLKGRTIADVRIGNVGDTDGDGLEQAPADVTDLAVSGVSLLYGPVHVSLSKPALHTLPPTTGEIEENVNTQNARLDLPPFAPSGTASSDFDLYFSLQVGDSLYHNHVAKHLFGTLTQFPPAPGEEYRNFVTTSLLNDAEAASAYQARRLLFTAADVHPTGTQLDSFPASRLAIEVSGPWGFDELVMTGMSRTATFLASLADTDANHLDQMSIKLTQMNLTSPGGVFHHIAGPVTIQLSDSLSSGQIEEAVNYTPGLLDVPPFTPVGSGTGKLSSIQFSLSIPGKPVLHLQQRALLAGAVHHVPAAYGDTYRENGAIALVDPAQQPSGLAVTALRLTPLSGGSVDVPAAADAPRVLAIQDVRPNPTSGSTTVTLALPQRGSARLAAYDVNGRLVRTLWNGEMEAGVRTITWDGKSDRGARAPDGIYFLRFESANQRSVRRLAILR